VVVFGTKDPRANFSEFCLSPQQLEGLTTGLLLGTLCAYLVAHTCPHGHTYVIYLST
jgi:hypothetical protein